MKKNFLVIFLFLVFLSIQLLITGEVQAQEEKGQTIGEEKNEEERKPVLIVDNAMDSKRKKFTFGGNFGWVIHSQSTNDASDSKGGYGFGALFEVSPLQDLRIRGKLGYSAFSDKETLIDYYGRVYTLTMNLSDISIKTYLLFSLPLQGEGPRIYFGPGLGVHNLNLTAKLTDFYGNSVSDSESSTNLALDLIAGISFPIRNLNLFFELGYDIVNVPNDWYDTYNEFALMGGFGFSP